MRGKDDKGHETSETPLCSYFIQRSGISGAMAIDVVKASPQQMWRTVLDIDSEHSCYKFNSSISAVTRLDRSTPGSPLKLGTYWKEKMLHPKWGWKYFHKWVVDIKNADNEYCINSFDTPKSISLSVSLQEANAVHGTTVARYTYTVHPSPGDVSSCKLSLSFALVPGGVMSRIAVCIFGRILIKRILTTLRKQLDTAALAAEEYERSF